MSWAIVIQLKCNMLSTTTQETSGDQSPNVIGNSNIFNFATKDKLANEVATMLNVITLIPEVAREQGVTTDEVQHPKDLVKKIKERFSSYDIQLKSKFAELHVLYGNSYGEAKRNSGDNEFGFEEMHSYLRNLSLDILSKNNNNPIKALKSLCVLFEEKFAKGAKKDFSVSAIEYVLYKQLVDCNVFPNPIEA